MTRPEILLLDEPTGGLDPLMEQEFRHCVARGVRARADGVPVLAHPVEVEELCAACHPARGHLVEVSSVDALRQMHTSELEIDLHEQPDLDHVDGVGSVERTPNSLQQVKLSGSPRGTLAHNHRRRRHRAPIAGSRGSEEIFLTY